MAEQLVIIGVGPGTTEMLTPEAFQAIRKAEILVGSERILNALAMEDQVCYELSGDLASLRLNLIAWTGRKVALLVSGDPGFFSILDWVKREFPTNELLVIPGISSMQLAFARIAQSWYDCIFISLHGRAPLDLTGEVMRNKKVCLLTDDKNTPATIVRLLQKAGINDKWLFIGSDLGTPNERIWQGKIYDYQETNSDQPYSVVILEDENLAL